MTGPDPKDLELIRQMAADPEMQATGRSFFLASLRYRYSYNYRWLRRPVIQYPQHLMAMQEIIWETKPDVIVETGVAHGGSLIFYASLLELLKGPGRVIGVDIEIRPPNRQAIEAHPLAGRISLIEGSSIDAQTVSRVK